MDSLSTSTLLDISKKNVESKDKLVSIQAFPQLKRHQSLRTNLLRALYARLTNNHVCFKAINRRYIRAFKQLSPTLTTVSKRVVSDLNANGIAFAEFSEFFDPAFFDIIKNCFYDYLEKFNLNPANIQLNKGKGSYLDTIHKSHTFIPNDPVSTYLSHYAFAAIASHYMQMIPRFVGSSFWRTRIATGEDRIYSQQWHRDYNDRALVKIFLYVTDVGPHEGYFEYFAGSHGYSPLRQAYDKIGSDGYRMYPDAAKIETFMHKIPIIKLNELSKEQKAGEHAPWYRKPTIIQCQAPKGTLIFADTFGLHRGGYVKAGHRDMIMTTYSTNFNIHKPHFAVTHTFASQLDSFMQMSFGIV